jgi:pSer/pThr/pTyr-binding forkhead associated (FHA) protein
MELLVLDGPDTGRSFTLGPQSVVGRDPTSAIYLTDEEVSRRHALVTIGEGSVLVEDLGSSNGTFVDGERISKETEMHPGEYMKVGQTTMELRGGRAIGDPDDLPSTKVPLPEIGPRDE